LTSRLALPARSIGDIVDRRRLILITETWMVGVAVVPVLVWNLTNPPRSDFRPTG